MLIFAVVPVLVGPLQVLIAVLPGILFAVATVLISLFKPRVLKQLLLVAWRMKLQLVVVALFGYLAVWGMQTWWPRQLASELEATDSDWPMFRGGLLRRGSEPGSPGPTVGGPNWVYRKGAEGFFSSPAVLGNRVYVASAELGAFSQKGAIYCFDADSGAVVWRSVPDGYRATFSSPAISGHYLVCGEGLHVTSDARLICLDIRAESAGKVLWTHETASHVECTPVIDGERVFVGAGDDGYYCFHLKPQPPGQSQVIWHLPGEKYRDAETSLAVHDGKVYAGLGLGGRALCVLDAATGEELRRIDMPYPVFGPPAISRGKLYVGLGNGDYVHTAEEAAELQLARLKQQGKTTAELDALRETLGAAGEVWCFDLATLKPDWKLPVGQTILGAIAVAEDALYAATRAGHVISISLDGKEQGRFNARAPIVTSPGLTDDHVYVVTNAGTLFGIDRVTLDSVWQFAVSAQPLCVSSPTVARGHVYVGTQHDGFVCVGVPSTGKKSTALWSGYLGGPGRAGNVDNSPLPNFPAVQWQVAGETLLPVAIADGTVVVAQQPSPEHPPRLIAFQDDGETPAWELPLAEPLADSPAIVDDVVLFVGRAANDSGRSLYAVTRSNGSVRKRIPLASAASGLLTATANELIIQTEAETLARFGQSLGFPSATGTGEEPVPEWSVKIGSLARPPVVTEIAILAAIREPPSVVMLDRETGRELWRQSLPATPVSSPVVAKTRYYVGTERGLFGGSLVGGSRLRNWSDESPEVTGELALTRDWIAYIAEPGDLVLVSTEDGRVLRKADLAQPRTTPLASRNQVIFASADGLVKLAADDPKSEPEVWFDVTETGPLLAPPVLFGAKVYFGTAKGCFRIGAE